MTRAQENLAFAPLEPSLERGRLWREVRARPREGESQEAARLVCRALPKQPSHGLVGEVGDWSALLFPSFSEGLADLTDLTGQ